MKAGIDYIGVGCGCLIINKNNEVLLQKRTDKTNSNAGEWSRPGGTVEFGEKVEDALIREIQEELNIGIEIIKFLEYTDNILIESGVKKHWLALGFLARIKSGKLQNLEPEKHIEMKWFSLDNLPHDLTQYTRNSISKFKELK
jgi:8-oxo-dGTP diphosphatase